MMHPVKRTLLAVLVTCAITFSLFHLSTRVGSVPPSGLIIIRSVTTGISQDSTTYVSSTANVVGDTKQDASTTPEDQAYVSTLAAKINAFLPVDAKTTSPTLVQNSEDSDSASLVSTTANKEKTIDFLYLVQTEGCLQSYLRTSEALGNGSFNFHVLVLSFKQSCDDRSLSHVEYIFNDSTTWTTGRNLLFTTAMKKNITYLYYIFMDDDVTVVDIRTNAVAWRAFENFLLSMEPAVMALDLPGQDYSEKVLQIHRGRGCFMEEFEYVTGLWYDAMINAFHYKAVNHLLPYISAFDQQTWWASQMALIVKTEILFRGQLVLHRYIRCSGSQHRPYPRDLNFTPNMYSLFTQGLDTHVAPGCVAICAQTMIDQWMKFGNANGWRSSTLCLPPPPPHDPVEPCRYQCSLV